LKLTLYPAMRSVK